MTTPLVSRSPGRPDRPVKALVLAAGEGTRLRPLTLTMPKPMVPICGTPLLEIIVRQLVDAGISDIAINLNYKPQAITDHFGDGAAFGAQIHYAHERALLGSAGAAHNVRGWLGASPLLLVYGDVLSDVDYRALVAAHDVKCIESAQKNETVAPGATLCLYRVGNPTEVGLVGMDDTGRITRFLEKPAPEHVFTDVANAGLCLLEAPILTMIDDAVAGPRDFGLHVFPAALAADVPMFGWMLPEDGYLIDIGSPEKYARANAEWARRQTARLAR